MKMELNLVLSMAALRCSHNKVVLRLHSTLVQVLPTPSSGSLHRPVATSPTQLKRCASNAVGEVITSGRSQLPFGCLAPSLDSFVCSVESDILGSNPGSATSSVCFCALWQDIKYLYASASTSVKWEIIMVHTL